MTRLDAQSRLEDLKAELGSMALRQESQNRPVKLVIIAGVVLIASAIFLGIGISRRFSADAKLEKARGQSTEMLGLADRLGRLKAAAQERAGANLGDPIESIRSRIKSAGSQAGLTSEVPLPRQEKTRGGADAVQQRLTYEVHDVSMEAVVRWIEAALKGTSGLEVYSLSIRPEASQWKCIVTFSRWEWDKGT